MSILSRPEERAVGVGEAPRRSSLGVTWRSVLIGIVLIPINCFWVTVVEVRWFTLDGTCLPLLVTPVFMLFVLTLLNLLVRRKWPRAALDQGELLTVYIMVVISCTLAGHDMLQNLFGVIGHPYWLATPENKWQEKFFRYLPEWLFVRDKEALRGFYTGNRNPFTWDIVRFWVGPLAFWGLFVFVLALMMLCLNVLIRRQWTENEKLAFPIVQLPVAMTDQDTGPGSFFRSRLMWGGFAVAFTVGLINGLNYLYPSVPALKAVKLYDLGPYFTQRPWNAMGWTPISMYPFAIGLAFFMPSDLSFSCWFFYVFRKLQQIVGSLAGWDRAQNSGYPYFNEQSAGAWVMLGLVVLWVMRGYLKQVARIVLGDRRAAQDSGEIVQYRWAVLGLLAGGIFCWVFTALMGMSPWVIIIFFGIYFLLSFTMTRVRAELGTPHEIYFVNPQKIMVPLFGTGGLGAQNLTLIMVLYWFNRCYRCHPMPNQLESFKMAEGGRIAFGRLIALTFFATLAGMAATYWANLHVTYQAGATAKAIGFKSWLGWESFGWLDNWITYPAKVEPVRIAYMIGGAAVVLFLRAMRGAFIWWPFHPAGYALAVSFAMDYFWFAFFISWLAKSLLVRYGGMKLHRQAIPFFLGLILGDYVVGSLWAIIGPALGMSTYKIFI
ncbi:MAG: hypothetical protein IT210_02780 [Armatimonadetes bacterium]|nr:hypothetical protein [Armatimonadota bacterium]